MSRLLLLCVLFSIPSTGYAFDPEWVEDLKPNCSRFKFYCAAGAKISYSGNGVTFDEFPNTTESMAGAIKMFDTKPLTPGYYRYFFKVEYKNKVLKFKVDFKTDEISIVDLRVDLGEAPADLPSRPKENP